MTDERNALEHDLRSELTIANQKSDVCILPIYSLLILIMRTRSQDAAQAYQHAIRVARQDIAAAQVVADREVEEVRAKNKHELDTFDMAALERNLRQEFQEVDAKTKVFFCVCTLSVYI